MPKRLKDRHSGDYGLRLRLLGLLAAPLVLVSGITGWRLASSGAIPSAVGLLFPLGGFGLAMLLRELIWWATGRTSELLTGTLLSGRGISGGPGYSFEESLVIRGKYAEAAESYRSHIARLPEDIPVRFRLADLLLLHLGDTVEAERLYREIRRLAPTPDQEFRATNALIDLYRETGNRGGLMAELARFSAANAGSTAAEAARRELAALKAPAP